MLLLVLPDLFSGRLRRNHCNTPAGVDNVSEFIDPLVFLLSSTAYILCAC